MIRTMRIRCLGTRRAIAVGRAARVTAVTFALLSVTGAGTAWADTIYNFTTGTNGNTNQSGTAVFDFSSASMLALTLTNTGDIVDISGILDDFHFNFSGTPLTAVLTSITDQGADTCTKGPGPAHIVTCTHDSNTNPPVTDWSIALTGAHIDMVAGTGMHPNGIVNSSFVTNAALDGLTDAQHNPVLDGPVTFDILLTGLTSIPTISSVDFTFGTTPDHIAGQPSSSSSTSSSGGGESSGNVPEPSSSSLALLGVAMLGATFLMRRMSQQA